MIIIMVFSKSEWQVAYGIKGAKYPKGEEYPTANKESPMKKEREYDLQDRPLRTMGKLFENKTVDTGLMR